jgi:hypothetical protein
MKTKGKIKKKNNARGDILIKKMVRNTVPDAIKRRYAVPMMDDSSMPLRNLRASTFLRETRKGLVQY